MGLLQMSLYGAVMIAVVVLIRTALVNRLPKRTFIILWCIVLARLLIPFEITSDFSFYSLFGSDVTGFVESRTLARIADEAGSSLAEGLTDRERQSVETAGDSGIAGIQFSKARYADSKVQMAETPYTGGNAWQTDMPESGEAMSDGDQGIWVSGFARSKMLSNITDLVNPAKSYAGLIIYGIGVLLGIVYFATAYVRCRFEFSMSLPVSDDYVLQWLEERRGAGRGNGILSRFGWRPHRLRSGVSVRVSDRIDTPLTYGVIHPVILLPKKTAWEQREQMNYILWHEYTHICHGDGVLKLFAAAALCMHWFNPLVWGMYFLLNRDIELSCDESVVHRCGVDDKSAYANMLIAMEAKRSGLVPLGNNFSQNAIEERVRAIMKMRKISIGAVIFAVGMVMGVTTAFATSAGSKEDGGQTERQMTKMSGNGGSMDDVSRDMLSALQFDGYEDMTVSAFQQKIWTLTDTAEYMELLERLEQDEAMYQARDFDETADFLFNVMEPLTGDRWQERDFGGAVQVSGKELGQEDVPTDAVYDMAVLEYEMTLFILDADVLTVGEYTAARLETAERINNMMFDYTAEELADEERMQREIERRMRALTTQVSTEELRVDVAWVYQPRGSYAGSNVAGESAQSLEEWERSLEAEEQALHAAIQEEIQEDLDVVLQPYLQFGLTYEYDAQAEDFKMYFKGREVRGIIDENQGIFVSAHTGISAYAEDSIEVYTVYDEAGNLAGLRAATEEEQEDWSLRRRQATDGWHDVSEEVREYLPGTSEDYDLILSLKKEGYDKMTLADFNSALLDWANAHSDSYDRIECDRIWDDFRVNLAAEDKAFVTRTVRLSGIENGMLIRSLYRGETEEEAEDASIGATLTKNPGEEAPQHTWCQMYYSFSYHVSDKEKVTVGERDRAVGGMLDGIEDFWNQTDIEELLKMEKRDIIQELNDLAVKHSTRNIKITIAEDDQIGFERMDERPFLQEQ